MDKKQAIFEASLYSEDASISSVIFFDASTEVAGVRLFKDDRTAVRKDFFSAETDGVDIEDERLIKEKKQTARLRVCIKSRFRAEINLLEGS